VDRDGVCRLAPFRFNGRQWAHTSRKRCPANATACASSSLAEALDDQRSVRPRKLADGCRHVFIDGGSNTGVHLRFLVTPDLFPDAHYTPLFSRHFGPGFASDPAVCAKNAIDLGNPALLAC
jgi:hypothetical protein